MLDKKPKERNAEKDIEISTTLEKKLLVFNFSISLILFPFSGMYWRILQAAAYKGSSVTMALKLEGNSEHVAHVCV